jgi:TonB-linked SusC/RagA family outer membrane protein
MPLMIIKDNKPGNGHSMINEYCMTTLKKITNKGAGSRRNWSGTLFSSPKKYLTEMNNFNRNIVPFRTIGLAVFLLFGFLGLRAQDSVLVRGVIVNGINEPLPNVSISIEGSNALPEITDVEGRFEFMVSSGNSWLIVAPPSGYKGKRVYLNYRNDLKIYLTPSDMVSGDDEVYFLARSVLKRNIVSSYSSLYTNEVHKTPVLSVDQYMQGRTPGMHVVNRSGDPGSGATTLIRGASSLNTSNQPLYIIDGIPMTPQGTFGSNLDGYSYNPLMAVNVMDISKTTIIKDPAITAAYGSKASNGLVIIETLDPSATQTTIELDLRSGYSLAPSNHIPQLNAAQHRTLINEVLFTSGIFSERLQELYPNLYLRPTDERFINYQHDTKWQDLIFQNSMFSNLNLVVKGGDEIARYGLSFGYMDNNGIVKETGYQGYNLRFVSLLNIFTWLRMNAAVSLNYNTSNLKESAIVGQTSPILTALAKSPMLNPYKYDLEGQELTILSDVEELGISNPLAVINNYEARNSNYYFISTLGFEASLRKNMLLNTTFGLTYNVLKEQIFMPNIGMEHYYNDEARNVAKASNNSIKAFNNNTYLRYFQAFGNDHYISSTTGVNIMSNNFEFDWGLTKNAHANDQYRMLQDGTNSLREIGGDSRVWTWLSFYENFIYSYKDRYLATASLAIDGSSRVGDNAANTLKVGDVPFGFFYSGGLAWRVSGESFLRDVSWLEEFKLRVSAGQSGNDDIGEANATRFYRSIKFRETVGLYPATLANDELTYERVGQINAGVDLSLWGNRWVTSFDVFNSTTNDMLIYTPLKSYLGYGFRPENGGKMQNKGWEVETRARIVDFRNFKWDFQANLSTAKNEITELKGDKLVVDIPGAQIVNMVGASANSFYGYIFEGVYHTTDEAMAAGLVNNRNRPFSGGDARFKDISGPNGVPDGVINDFDKTAIGSSLPEYYGGINNTFTYKKWALSAFVQFVTGNEVFNFVRFRNEQMSTLANQSTNVLNRWQYEGHQTDVPRALWNDPIGNSEFSTRWIEDGSYMRIKNLSLSYTIPDDFLAFRSAQFYVSASNLFTFSKYLGYDPEFSYSQDQLMQGIDYGLTPQPRQFIVGIKLGL